MSTKLTAVGGRQRLVTERHFEHPLPRVWRSVIEPEHLSVWHPATATELEPRLAGRVKFDYGEGNTTTATIVEYEDQRILAFFETSPGSVTRESDSLTRIELHPDTDTDTRAGTSGCTLLFTHEFDDRAAAASYASGWEGCLDALGESLAGRTPKSRMPLVDRYEQYIREFGLDEPVVELDGIRIERQLMMQPRAKVWDVLVPGAAPSLDVLVPAGMGDGVVTDLVDGESVDIAMADGSRIRWELGQGPGGARLLITHNEVGGGAGRWGAVWRDHIEALVRRII